MDGIYQDNRPGAVRPSDRSREGAPRAAQAGAWVLGSETHRRFVGSLVATAPAGWVVRLDPPRRNLDQNALLHAALSDIAAQVEWHGQKFDVETWKRLCVAAWIRERGGNPQLVPALDGHGFDIVYQPTSKLTKGDFSELCEWVFAFAAQHGVTLREPRT